MAAEHFIDLTADPDDDLVDEERERDEDAREEDWHFLVELAAASHRFTRIVGTWTRGRYHGRLTVALLRW
jgi:hypothetical protein